MHAAQAARESARAHTHTQTHAHTEECMRQVIRDPRLEWKEARALLRLDSRYDSCADALSSDERQRRCVCLSVCVCVCVCARITCIS